MDDVSIVLSIRQCTGNNEVELVGECEKGYNQYALYAFAGSVIKRQKHVEERLFHGLKSHSCKSSAMPSDLNRKRKRMNFGECFFKCWK